MSKPSFTVSNALRAKTWMQAACDSATLSYHGDDATFYLAECERGLREAAKILGFRLEPINAPKQEVK